MKRIALLPGILILWLCAACGSCDRAGGEGAAAPNFGPTEDVPTVRVRLQKNAGSVPVAVEGPYRVEDGKTSRMISQGASLPRTELTFGEGMFVLGPAKLGTDHLVITPQNDGSVVVGDSRYRGQMHFWGGDEGVTVVNHVNMEHYLAGVVPAEMKISWPEAALQAQAVAARTYALWRMQGASRRDLKWDLTSGSDSQVYGGLDRESDKSRKVIVDTAGTVLVHDGEIFPTYYHSTCGGFTADAHVVFGGKEMPCLTGVPCGNCRDSPVYEWSFTLTQEELAQAVKEAAGKDIGRITEIERVEPDAGERPQQVVFKGEKGQAALRTSQFRTAVGTKRMKSSAFTFKKLADSFKILGSGWGHGVGMCQWGAAGMADPMLGFTAEEILKHYYQGAQLQRIY